MRSLRCLFVALALCLSIQAPASGQARTGLEPLSQAASPPPALGPAVQRWGAGVVGGAAGAALGWYAGKHMGRRLDGAPCRPEWLECERADLFETVGPWVGATLLESVAVPLAMRAIGGGRLRSALGPSVTVAVIGLTGGALIYGVMDSPPLALAFSGAALLVQLKVVAERLEPEEG